MQLARSTFAQNAAPAGPVAFLDGWATAAGGRRAAPACSPACAVGNNTAPFWGAGAVVSATNIASAALQLSTRRVSSGSAFNVSLTLFDGFGNVVTGALPGATATLTCTNCSAGGATLLGAAPVSYSGANSTTLGGLSLVNAQRLAPYALSVAASQSSQAGAGSGLLLSGSVTATASIELINCTAMQIYNNVTGQCGCITKATVRDGECKCNEGFKAVYDGTHMTCVPCNDGAGHDCGSGVLIPGPGFWNSCPNSPGAPPLSLEHSTATMISRHTRSLLNVPSSLLPSQTSSRASTRARAAARPPSPSRPARHSSRASCSLPTSRTSTRCCARTTSAGATARARRRRRRS